MSIDMYLGSSKAQGSSASALSQSYQAGFQVLQAAVGQFTQDTLLRSQAYDSGKSYFQGVYIPLIQGAILVAEATGKAVEKLPNDYVSQVDSCDLRSSELEAEIQRYETQIQGMQNQMDQIKQLLPVSSERVQHLREASGLISDYTSAKRKLEKQLQKLLAFHAFSSTLFTEVTSLQTAVNQGLAQVSGGKGFDPKTGTFSPKNLKDTRWMITIGNAWDKRQKEIAEINRKARVEREMAALQEAAKIAGADIAMNSFMMNVGLMNMGPSIYGNLKDYGSQKALTASLRPTGTMSRSNMKVSGGELPQKYQQIIKKNSSDYNYSRSVLEKAKLDPHYHDFPKNLDNEILSNPVLTRPDGRIEHLAKGTINGEKGIYHITLKGDKIIHRTFIPESGWARFAKVNGLPEYVNIPSLK